MTPERFQLIKSVLDRRQAELTIIADGIHKTHNIAAVIRSCDAVGVLDIHAVSPGGEIPRHHATAAGVSRWSRIHTHSSVDRALYRITDGRLGSIANDAHGMAAAPNEILGTFRADQDFQILAAHQSDTSVDFREIDFCQPTAILLGTELEGVSQTAQDLVDQHIFVPMQGMVESLNVSVAAAVILYEAQRQRQRLQYHLQEHISPKLYNEILFEWTYPKIARRCRETKRPYPDLDDSGQMLSNPLTN